MDKTTEGGEGKVSYSSVFLAHKVFFLPDKKRFSSAKHIFLFSDQYYGHSLDQKLITER